jgi:hypothetical protein
MGGKIQVSRPWGIGRAGNGVGGGVLSIKDLLSYTRFHMHSGLADEGRRVMPIVAIESMQKPLVDDGSRGTVGLSWFIKKFGDVQFFSHGGATNGQQAYTTFVPKHDLAASILTNAEAGGIITDKLRAMVAEIWFDIKESAPQPAQATHSELDDIAGLYELPISAFSLKRRGDVLILTDIPRGGFPTPDSPPGEATRPMRVSILEGDRLLVLDEPRKGAIAELFRDPDGHVAYCCLGARVHPKTIS